MIVNEFVIGDSTVQSDIKKEVLQIAFYTVLL